MLKTLTVMVIDGVVVSRMKFATPNDAGRGSPVEVVGGPPVAGVFGPVSPPLVRFAVKATTAAEALMAKKTAVSESESACLRLSICLTPSRNNTDNRKRGNNAALRSRVY
jgi:hypothetical protein